MVKHAEQKNTFRESCERAQKTHTYKPNSLNTVMSVAISTSIFKSQKVV